jgi:FkbM family methyltransferase
MQNVDAVEPLAMAAFAAAIRARQRASPAGPGDWIIDVGSNMGMYALVGASIAPSFKTIAVDMQPMCVQVTRCHLTLNNALNRTVVLNNFVSSNATAPAIDVPSKFCDSMASPTAVGGRRPDGRMRAHSNAIAQGRFNRSELQPVYPIVLGSYVQQRMQRGERVAVVKIDTEGYEPLVLEALRPLWPLVDNFVVELQPHAWTLHKMDVEVVISRLRELVEVNGLSLITLPHPHWTEQGPSTRATTEMVDGCKLPRRISPLPGLGWMPHPIGLHKAEVYNANGMVGMLREVLAQPPGSFYEILLTRLQC